MRTVVEAVLGGLALAYYGFKIVRNLYREFGKSIVSWLRRRSRVIVIRNNDNTTVTMNGPSVEEIQRILQAESQPPQQPEPEREEENPSG